jgi:CrcB protein
MPDPQTPLYLKALQLALAGAAGTLARWGVYSACEKWLSKGGWHLPAATLSVNIIGSFLFGLVWAVCDRGQITPHTRAILLGGFMGAFTTFSSFAFDTGELIARQNYIGAAGNILANNVLGIGAFFFGLWAATLLPRTA